MFYADQIGLHEVARALTRIAARPGVDAAIWAPAPLLTRLASQGKTFNGFKGSHP
jgi:3-hydroxyacyl-CoA dehydrogenase